MKRIQLLTLSLFAGCIASAAPITSDQALSVARKFRKAGAARSEYCVLAYAGTQLSPSGTRNASERFAYYAFNYGNNEGFVIVSADDELTPVMGYATNGSFTGENIPEGLNEWLTAYSAYVYAVQNGSAKPIMRSSGVSEGTPVVGPLCTTKWGQTAPFNDDCPAVNGTKTVAGCGALSTAQVMKYHNWPENGTGSIVYESKLGSVGSVSADFSQGNYNWEEMLDVYLGVAATDNQKSAVAKLCFHAGAACEMGYNVSMSSAYQHMPSHALIEYFGYSPESVIYRDRMWYSDEEWTALVTGELEAGRPMIYCGTTAKNEGHSFVCDGYDTKGMLHINWGWEGQYDGYYHMDLLDPDGVSVGGGSGTAGGFCYYQSIISGIKPAVEGETYAQAEILYCKDFSSMKSSCGRSENFIMRLLDLGNSNFNRKYNGKIGFALYRKGTLVTLLNTRDFTLDPAGLTSGTTLISCKIDASIPNGDYQIRVVSRENGYDEWLPARRQVQELITELPIVLSDNSIQFNVISGIGNTEMNKPEIVECAYYDLQGKKVPEPQKNEFVIEKTRYSDGTVVSRRVIIY